MLHHFLHKGSVSMEDTFEKYIEQNTDVNRDYARGKEYGMLFAINDNGCIHICRTQRYDKYKSLLEKHSKERCKMILRGKQPDVKKMKNIENELNMYMEWCKKTPLTSDEL